MSSKPSSISSGVSSTTRWHYPRTQNPDESFYKQFQAAYAENKAALGAADKNEPTSDHSAGATNAPYDFTDLTQKQLHDLTGKLYQSGQITFQESGYLGALGRLWKVDSYNVGVADAVHLNVISSLETTISTLKQHPGGNSPIKALENILATLGKLQSAAPIEQTTETPSAQENLDQIGKRYDVTNISNRDAAKLSLELRDGGFLSPFEAANLSIAIAPLGSTFSPTAQRNLLEQFQTSLAYAQQGAAPEQIASLENIVDVLRKLRKT